MSQCRERVAGLSAVVPAYNSEGSLPELVSRLAPVLVKVAEAFELVLVNDGSRDRTWVVIQEQCAAHPWIRGIDLMRNCGQHNALLCGIRAARHPFIVTLDDAASMSPALRLSTATEVVIGARISKTGAALAQPGDLQGLSPAVAVGAHDVRVEISDVVK